jgi:pimeloyl-ACP methyl ester carboxylesterase
MPAIAWVDDLRELLDQLGVTSFHLVGSSLGSRVAMRYTIDHPERVRSIAVINPIIAVTPEATARLNAAGGEASKLAAAQQTEMERLHGVDWRDVVLNYFNIRNKPDLQSFFDLSGLVDQIAVPMLIVRTDNVTNLAHPFLHTYELRNRVENSQMGIVPNFGASQIRIASDKLNELIFDFYERLVSIPAA